MIPRTVKLYTSEGKFLKELDLPAGFKNLPEVVFYGAQAFHSVLVANGNYHECTCWNAGDPEQEQVQAKTA